MAQDRNGPPSEPQKELAVKLGITFDKNTTFGTLSDLITEAKQKQSPSDAQIEFARNLGIKFDDTITAPQLRKLLDAEIKRQSQAALRDNPVLVVGETIMYKDNAYEITAVDRRRWRVQLKPCFRGLGRGVAPMVITLKDATHVDVIQQQKKMQ